eukprot:9729595-Alexandrium_andersonii.AAC.1
MAGGPLPLGRHSGTRRGNRRGHTVSHLGVSGSRARRAWRRMARASGAGATNQLNCLPRRVE